MYSTGKYTQFSVMAYMGEESKKEWRYIYISRDKGLIPGSGSSPGVGNGNPLQYSCLGNSMDREAFWATVHGVAELDITEHVRAGTQTHTDTHRHTHTPDSLCCTPETNTTL